MEKSKDKRLLELMHMLESNLEEFRIREWRTIRNKYLQEKFDLLKSYGKI